jgi:Bacteriophage head to tail connecting protein
MTHEDDILHESLHEFSELQTWRAVFGQHWEEVAELVDPPSRNTFFYGTFNWPGLKKTDRQVDATAMMALDRFCAILDSLLTPRNMMWHGLLPSDDNLMKNRAVRLWFEDTTRKLFKYRYAPIANFSAQNLGQYRSLGAYGTGCMYIDRYQGPDRAKGLRYKSIPLGQMFLRENHQGLIDGFSRWYRLTGRQAVQKFGRDNLPEALLQAAEKSVQMPFDFLHRVVPRADYDPERLDAKGKIFASYDICLNPECFLVEGGYNSFPIAASRYTQTPGEIYGRGWCMTVLPAIKTLNSEKRDFLTQGHRAASPVLLTTDDGVVDFSMRPGALNKGGMSSDGKLLVGMMPTGNIQTSKEMMDEERALINDAALVTLFQILTEQPQMSATEVIERTNEKGILLAPTVGRQQNEYLGPLIDRELDILADMKLLAPMPPALQEAKGEYTVMYTSPISRAMRAQEAAGFMRTLETAVTVANSTQDPSVFDVFDFPVALPEIADIQAVPTRWMADQDQISQKQKARAAAAEKQQQIQAAPAAAALVKAHAQAAQSGAPQQPQQP